jgi:leucyl aminopeptidase
VLGAKAATQAVTEGVQLGLYEFLSHKSKPLPSPLTSVWLLGTGEGAGEGLQRGRTVAEAVMWARDLVNEPGGRLSPTALADAAVAFGEAAGLTVKVRNRKAIKAMGLGGLLGVNRGSANPPRFIELRWRPPGDAQATVALVGKGITFDSGGLSIKTGTGMMTMKSDMAGAAAVMAAVAAVARLQLPVEVRVFVSATDNMTGPDAMRPGDVLKLRNGKTIEVLNTDAEGRLVLADALSVASESNPDAIIDLATLTGACRAALGARIAGVMGNNDALLAQVETAAANAGEPVWRLPLPPDYRKQIESNVADMKNIGSGEAGALVAGLILQEFVGEGIPWAHLDIAGPAFVDGEDGEYTKGATGFGTRLLVDLIERFEKPQS